MSKGIFITGTSTDIGKTYISAHIITLLKKNGVNVTYFKPALSGAIFKENGEIECDATYVIKKAGLKDELSALVPFIYKNAVSPHLASKLENNLINLQKIKSMYDALCKKYSYIIVEGCGGIVCPICDNKTLPIMQEDIIKELGLSCIIVGNSSLGAINSCVLTSEYMKSKQIPIKGFILNHFEEENFLHLDNKKMIEQLTNIPVIATVAKNDISIDINVYDLLNIFN